MGVTVLFDGLDLIELGEIALHLTCLTYADFHEGHAFVLVIFCAGGLGLIGYVKLVKSHPTVSVACSLASMSIITILTKEGWSSQFENNVYL
jgi:hypothetical protein